MVFILWVALCLAIGYFAKKRGRSFWTFALLSVIISPIGGCIVLLFAGKKSQGLNPTEHDVNMSMQQLDTPQSNLSEMASTFCSSCGSKVYANSKFCPNCGTKVHD